jgi:hypothetical protein
MVGERRRPVPTERRRLGRRRARVRGMLRFAFPMVLSAVVVILAVSAVAHIGAASGPYRRTVDRGYVALAAPLAAQSNASAVALRTFLADAHSLGRPAFFSDLDTLVADTAAQWRRYDAITPPEPVTGARCATAMADRATAVSTLRTALEGVLGGRSGLGVIDPGAAVSAVHSAGATLALADASWAACRRALRGAPGSAVIPASVWVRERAVFETGALTASVSAMEDSHSLAPVHSLVILAVVTDPAAVASGPTLVVPATLSIVTHVVLSNAGNVAEQGVELGGEATVLGATAKPVLVQRRIDLAAGRSTTALLPALKVQPGASYTVQVVAESPKSNGTGSLASRSVQVQVQLAATLTSVTSEPLVALRGHPVTLIADVASSLSGIGPPTGTVAFQDAGTTVPGCASQPVHDGQATCVVTYPTVSDHSVTAAYSGDTRDAGSMGPAITLKVDG